MSRAVSRARILVTLVYATALIVGCSAAGDGSTAKDLRPETAAGLAFSVPKEWESTPPTSSMRAAQFALPAEKEGAEAPELALFFFGAGQGGNTQANIDRWINQMQQPDGKPSAERAQKESQKVGKYQVSVVRVDGDYGGGMAGAMNDPHANPHDAGTKKDYRLWAAVVEGDGGPWFFKVTGPRAAVEKAEPGFKALIASLKPGPKDSPKESKSE